MKRKLLGIIGIAVFLIGGTIFSFWLYDNQKDMGMYHRGVLHAYDDTLADYKFLLSLQREIVAEEDAEVKELRFDFYEKIYRELYPQANAGETLKMFYVENNPDSAVADYDFYAVADTVAAFNRAETDEARKAAIDNFEKMIEQLEKELEIIESEMDLPVNVV